MGELKSSGQAMRYRVCGDCGITSLLLLRARGIGRPMRVHVLRPGIRAGCRLVTVSRSQHGSTRPGQAVRTIQSDSIRHRIPGRGGHRVLFSRGADLVHFLPSYGESSVTGCFFRKASSKMYSVGARCFTGGRPERSLKTACRSNPRDDHARTLPSYCLPGLNVRKRAAGLQRA